MCFDSDGSFEFSASSAVKARKPHACQVCGEQINAGETYERRAGKFDGSFFSEITCRRCCYDTYRIVQTELAEGCHWHEAWPPQCEVLEYLHDSGMGQTAPLDVPASYTIGSMPEMRETNP